MRLFTLLSLSAVLGVGSFQLSYRNHAYLDRRSVFTLGESASADTAESTPHAKPANVPKELTPGDDTLLKFSNDVATVLRKYRASDYDPTLPAHIAGGKSELTYSKTWSLEDWEFHNSRMRYIRYLTNFPFSRLLRRIMPQQCALLTWTLLCLWMKTRFPSMAPNVPMATLGTVSSFMAFLLSLRCNHALSRLIEARKLWSKVIVEARELSQVVSNSIYPIDKQMALMLGRHLALFGVLLKNQLRYTQEDDMVEIIRTMIPNKNDADYVLSQREKPVAVTSRARQVLTTLMKQHLLTPAEEIGIDHMIHHISDLIVSVGSIRATPIPPYYTSHTSRLLMIYLISLPLALTGMSNVVTTVVTMLSGFAIFGLDETSHLFEQPFRMIPMYQLSKRVAIDVADSFTCKPPQLPGEIRDDEQKQMTQKELTTYWSEKDIATVKKNLPVF